MTGPAQTKNPPNSDRAFRDASLVFNLASNPLRLRVLVSLTAGIDTIQQLADRLGIDRRVINQHLHALLQAKLVESTRRGRGRIYAPTRSGHLLIDATESLTGTSVSRNADLSRRGPPAASGVEISLPIGANDLQGSVNLLKAIADPIRIRLLNLLISKPEVCVCHLHEALELPQSTVSRHLTILRQAGLALSRRRATWVYYRLAFPASGLGQLLAQYVGRSLLDVQEFENDRRRLSGLVRCVDQP
jgi:ArsR family transcriptional regulator, arsenate/arsenite/antimonite-responsive transcriptional repressor